MMADHGFPVSHDMLKKIAQDMLNSRKQPPKGKGKASVSVGTASEDPEPQAEVHVIGVHWVKCFLRRNPGFKKQYVRYQERARKAASNDEEAKAHFFFLLANLIRRYKVLPEDL